MALQDTLTDRSAAETAAPVDPQVDPQALADAVLAGRAVTPGEALAVLHTRDDEVLGLVRG
ncbi:hypothetical protein SDC9_57736 [bioreactor metagenome]|uniref:Uncharacterized protein n=1 Tax=bioreactor metagenome TaxID=1076179 RepID=A0A644XB43_9ZZZZ